MKESTTVAALGIAAAIPSEVGHTADQIQGTSNGSRKRIAYSSSHEEGQEGWLILERVLVTSLYTVEGIGLLVYGRVGILGRVLDTVLFTGSDDSLEQKVKPIILQGH